MAQRKTRSRGKSLLAKQDTYEGLNKLTVADLRKQATVCICAPSVSLFSSSLRVYRPQASNLASRTRRHLCASYARQRISRTLGESLSFRVCIMGYNSPTVTRRDEGHESIPSLSPSPTILSVQRKAAVKVEATAATSVAEVIASDVPVGPLPEYRTSPYVSFSPGLGCSFLVI